MSEKSAMRTCCICQAYDDDTHGTVIVLNDYPGTQVYICAGCREIVHEQTGVKALMRAARDALGCDRGANVCHSCRRRLGLALAPFAGM